ncbi:MAG: PAS domain S-box protein [Sphingomonadales bacterium]|jgi:two-component system sensor kinase FixL|nr:PAS domain S-box protein [Sphingomonadales bacterium]MBK6720857.1 PAS domain S-box protein [Sphingomonadales bacterium]MBK7283927.1 PAS domain S-box protein [Sphingomonadales bacterium]
MRSRKAHPMSPSKPESFAEVAAGEELLRSILATVPDAMIIIDTSGVITYFSAAAEQMFGYGSEEVLGQNIRLLMPEPDREHHDDYMRRYLETGQARIIGIGRFTVARRRNGEVFPIQLSIGEAGTGDGRVFSGFVRDLTEREEARVHLEELQNEIAHVSRVSAMGTMASSLAHELNQPLTAIANYVEGARDLLDNPTPDILETVREVLDDAARESVRAGQIVRGLRDFIGRGTAERRAESLPRLINQANALALIGAREMGIDVDLALDPQAETVFVAGVQVQQVLVNLIRNAAEAMESSDRRRLSIRTQRLSKEFVQVSVTDSGQGFAPESLDRLFEPFFSTKGEGMGLGLSICRTIVESLGGSIWAEQAAGGMTFNFTLLSADTEDSDDGPASDLSG